MRLNHILVAFADSCEATLRKAYDRSSAESLRQELFGLFDDLVEDAKKDFKEKDVEKFIDQLPAWLDDDTNFFPFRMGVSTLRHLVEIHEPQSGESVIKLTHMLDEWKKNPDKLKKFVVDHAKAIDDVGANDVVRHYVAQKNSRAAIIALILSN